MKKIVALLLALVMALSATLALAEPAKTQNDGMVLSSHINIDRDRIAQFMDEMKLDAKTRELVDSALAVVNAATDQLVITENGACYELFLKEKEVACFTFGKTDDGLVILSNLIPSHALTVSNDTVDLTTGLLGIASEFSRAVAVEREAEARAEAYKATATMTPYLTDFILETLPAIRLADEEKGEFVFENGKSYNTRLKISIDRQVVAKALNNMLSNMLEDSVIFAVLANVLVSEEDLANSAILADHVPVIDIALYANLDDNGEDISPDKAFTASITLPGESDVYATFELHEGESSEQAMLNIPGKDEKSGFSVAFAFVPYDKATNAGSATLVVGIDDNYYGDLYTVEFDEARDMLIAENDLYIQDPEKPLATAQTTIQTGAPALDLSIGDRHAISVESLLFDEEGEKLTQELVGEVVLSSLGIIGSATEAVPEFANLLALLNSAETEEAA